MLHIACWIGTALAVFHSEVDVIVQTTVSQPGDAYVHDIIDFPIAVLYEEHSHNFQEKANRTDRYAVDSIDGRGHSADQAIGSE